MVDWLAGFLRSLDSLRDIEAGFRRDHTVIASIDPSRNGYKGQRLREFYQRLLASVERIPGMTGTLRKVTSSNRVTRKTWT